MKIAISLPDQVFRAAEHLAQKLNKSRSQLYAEAITEYVHARGSRAVTAKLNAVYATDAARVDSALQYAALETLIREAW